MRKAKETDYWDKVYKRNYHDGLKKVNLNGLNNFNDEIIFSKGITVICGLNGAGKSTIVAAIKSVFGLPLTESDIYKLKTAPIQGEFLNGTTLLTCSSQLGNRLSELEYDLDKIVYLDCDESNKAQEFNTKQAYFEELLEQNEEYEFSSEEVEEINYLTGKKYQHCSAWEFEDIEGIGTIPYFKVSIDQIEYDSRSMGKGEHFLLYLFWRINKCVSGTIFIIEEPETYISICSQMHFSNYLGKQMAEKGVQVILTTHSPYLLEHIKNDNIRIVSRMGKMTAITTPDGNMMAEDILGVAKDCAGTLFVEDRVAYDFLSIILEDKAPYILKRYTIDIAEGGENAITQRLGFPQSEKIKYNFVGVYDGDMRERLDTNELHWKYIFLPGDMPLEELYRNFLHESKGIKNFCKYLGKTENHIITMLATIDGDDYHDWFEKLRKFLGMDGKALVRAFYNVMIDMNDAIENFIIELKECLD